MVRLKINCDILKQKCKEYEEEEGRASFYHVAKEIVDKYPLQASIIILATWNVGRFRFMASNSNNLVALMNAINDCKSLFEEIKDKNFHDVDFDEIREVIKHIYSNLSRIQGVEYTGSSKVMHLINSNLFVMWDGYIRKKHGYKNADANEYFDFLKKMQEKFKDIVWNVSDKTLAKAVDEYNYVTITLPELKKQGKRKKLIA